MLLDKLFGRECFGAAVPPGVANLLVQVLGEGFGEAVGEGFGHDRVVVVVIGFELQDQVREAHPAGNGERADGVCEAGLFRSDEVCKRAAGLVALTVRLLAEKVEALKFCSRILAVVEFDVVTDGVCGKETIDAIRGDQVLSDDAVQQAPAVIENLLRLDAVPLVLEDTRVNSFEPPCVEEGRPVDVVAQRLRAEPR